MLSSGQQQQPSPVMDVTPPRLNTTTIHTKDINIFPAARSPLALLTPPKIKTPSSTLPPIPPQEPTSGTPAVLSYLWPFTDTSLSNENSPDHAVDKGEESTRLETIKHQYLTLLNERNQLMTERNQLLLANKEKVNENGNFTQENPVVGKRVKELETKVKMDKAMIAELVAEKEYLDDRLRVSQGLVESSQELTSEKQKRIDELEKQLRMDDYKYQNELASLRAQCKSAEVKIKDLNDLVSAKQQRIDNEGVFTELSTTQTKLETVQQELINQQKQWGECSNENKLLREQIAELTQQKTAWEKEKTAVGIMSKSVLVPDLSPEKKEDPNNPQSEVVTELNAANVKMRTMLEDQDKRLTKANETIRNLTDELSNDKATIMTLRERLAEQISNNKKNCCDRLFGR